MNQNQRDICPWCGAGEIPVTEYSPFPMAPVAEIIKQAAIREKVQARDMLSGGRGKGAVARARHVAMLRMWEDLGMTLKEIGFVFDRDHSTVSHGIGRAKAFSDPPDPSANGGEQKSKRPADVAARCREMRRMWEGGMTITQIGREFGKDRTTVGHHVNKRCGCDEDNDG